MTGIADTMRLSLWIPLAAALPARVASPTRRRAIRLGDGGTTMKYSARSEAGTRLLTRKCLRVPERLDRAIADYDEAIRLQPQMSEAYYARDFPTR
jgi:hypothetical protein